MFNGIKGWFGWLAINQQCVLCHQLSKALVCPYCFADLPRFNMQNEAQNLLCNPKILRELKVINFDRLFAMSEYQWPYSYLLSGLKFNRKVVFAQALSELFCHLELAHKDLPKALVPIPLHPSRMASRKYNQASIIGKNIAKHYCLKFLPQTLQRVVNSQAQTRLNSAQRMKNAQGIFTMAHELDVDHIAIFDDVITTGATVGAAVDAIRAQCPDIKIDVWALCITPERR